MKPSRESSYSFGGFLSDRAEYQGIRVKIVLLVDYTCEVLSMNPANKKAHAEGEVRQAETGISTALTEFTLSLSKGLPRKV
jgi:hypothetical protein